MSVTEGIAHEVAINNIVFTAAVSSASFISPEAIAADATHEIMAYLRRQGISVTYDAASKAALWDAYQDIDAEGRG